MPAQEMRILDYIVVCISEFAEKYSMRMSDAYSYMEKHKGIDFLKEFYDVEHTLSFDDAIEDVSAICRKNGGDLGSQRELGDCKGMTLVSKDHDIDDFNDEIEELFGVN